MIRSSRLSNRSEKQKKPLKKSDYVLIASIVAVIGYTIAAIVVQETTNMEISPTLTERWFQFWTVEIVVLSGIKVTNVINEHRRSLGDSEEEGRKD